MKSPLKDRPLRNPGQSLDEQLDDVIYNSLLAPLITAMIFVVFAGLEWFRFYRGMPPNPVVFSAMAILGCIYATVRIYLGRKRIRQMKLGRDGERAVGQFLEALRESGAKLFHDFPGKGFNIDHVVVHASGVYAVETKTFSKPEKGEALIVFKGDHVEVLGKKPDRNPVVQARANAKWLSDLIKESTGRVVPVRPVVVFPGWFVQPTAEARASDVWVLNPRMLPGFIARSAEQMTPPDAQMVAFHLSRYIRTFT